MWGVWGARKNLPKDPASLPGVDLARIAAEMTEDWHPNLRRLIELSDPSTVFRVNIRTSVPVSPWETSNVTLLGDAIHTMTPGRGVARTPRCVMPPCSENVLPRSAMAASRRSRRCMSMKVKRCSTAQRPSLSHASRWTRRA
jgi:hypothetical protein